MMFIRRLSIALCCLALLAGCRNPILGPGADTNETQPPSEPLKPGTGALLLAPGNSHARTIRPIWPDYTLFSHVLVFTPNSACAAGNTAPGPIDDWNGSAPIVLPEGIWDLELAAYLDGPAAQGSLQGITILAQDTVTYNIALYPIPAGQGTFAWDIRFHSGIDNDITLARMSVLTWPGFAVHSGPYYFTGGAPSIGAIYSMGNVPAGRYLVVFEIEHSDGETLSESHILHIYQNLTSAFSREFSLGDFPVLAHSYLLRSWNHPTPNIWNFYYYEITYAFFELLGIYGISAVNFNAVSAFMNTLTHNSGSSIIPADIAQFRVLTDAALVAAGSAAAGFLPPAGYWRRAEAEAALAALTANNTAVTSFLWQEDNLRTTASFGPYTVTIDFAPGIVLEPDDEGNIEVPWDDLGIAGQTVWLRSFARNNTSYVLYVDSGQTVYLTAAEAALPTGRSGLEIVIRGRGALATVSPSANGSLFTVGAGVTLVLENVTLYGRSAGGLAGVNNNEALVTVSGGALDMRAGSRITGNTNTGANGGGVHLSVANSRLTMRAGSLIDSNEAGNGGGVNFATGAIILDMQGGSIRDNRARLTGGGAHLGGASNNFTMHPGAAVYNNEAGTTGGGIHLMGGSVFTMQGGEISGNEASGSGGGVNRIGTGAFHMYGGASIFNNTSGGSGGGVNMASTGAFNMHTGANISGNEAGGNGGGLNVAVGATANIRGGEIFGNESTSGSGGGVANSGVFRIGDGTIYGNDETNQAHRNTAGSGASLYNSGGISQFGIFVGTTFTPSSPGSLFTTDLTIEVDNGYLLRPAGGMARPPQPVDGTLAEQLAWLRTYSESGENITITTSVNSTLSAAERGLPTGRTGLTVTLTGGANISTSENGSLFTVSAGLTLILENLTLQGRPANNAALVTVSGGALEMNAGARITGNVNSGAAGGAVHLSAANSRLTMRAGSLIDNNEAGSGGGVNLDSGVIILDMQGGIIRDNRARSTGGGAHLGGVSNSFTMHPGAAVYNNEAGTTGGGIHLAGSSVFTMQGGEISGNEASGSGGGVNRIGTGAFHMYGGASIFGNTSGGSGGGVNMASTGAFNMHTGTTIHGNEAGGNGGGLNIAAGATVNMRGGEIRGNTSSTLGGGVSTAGVFRISDGIIHGSNAAAALGNASDTYAAVHSIGGSEYGTFVGTVFTPAPLPGGAIFSTENTVRVENGVRLE